MKRIAIYITASIIYLSSCGPIDEWTEESVKRTISNYYFDYEASTQTLNVDDNGSFTYSSNESWCTIEWEYSRVIAVKANNSRSTRTTVTIRYGDEIMKTISVEQKRYPYIIGNLMVAPNDVSSDPIKWRTANNYCNNSTLFGYTNWRLPTGWENGVENSEIDILYNNRIYIGNFKNAFYWCSEFEEYWDGDDWYYMLDFGSNEEDWEVGRSDTSYNDTYARCVRTIN